MMMSIGTRSREREEYWVLNRRFTHDTGSVRAECVRGVQLGAGTICQCSSAGPASFKRLVQIAAAITANPQHSLPKACDDWADLKAAYRFLSNPRVTPEAIQSPHRDQTRARCAAHPLVLIPEDLSELDFTRRTKVGGLGAIGNGGGRGLIQHSALAVTPEREILGLLHQQWMIRPQPPEGETRKQRLARAKKTDIWSDAVKAIGSAPAGTRFIHVTDREADSFQMMQACDDHETGFLLRAQHDRCVEQGADKLWPLMASQPLQCQRTLEVPAGPKRAARKAKLELRFAKVTLDPPKQDPRFKQPRTVWVVWVTEPGPPKEIDPIEWMLLTSEPTTTVEEAWERVEWYRCRWLIEEFHKVEKSGCRLEASQLDEGADIQRLAAIIGVTAVRLLMLRWLADRGRQDPEQAPAALQRAVPWMWIVVVARANKKDPADPTTLTPREFWIRIARQGGYIGRRRDGRPGWSTIWKGWYEFMLMFHGAELMASAPPPRCG